LPGAGFANYSSFTLSFLVVQRCALRWEIGQQIPDVEKEEHFERLRIDKNVKRGDGILLISGVSCRFSRSRTQRKSLHMSSGVLVKHTYMTF
jgi:hypothetical protein